MTIGEDLLILIAAILVAWLIMILFIKKLFGDKRVICAACKRRVKTQGTAKCPKCGGILYKDFYKDDFYKK